MPRKEERCPDCLDKGYLSVLPWRHGDERKIVPCTCRYGYNYVTREVEPHEDDGSSLRVHMGV